MGGSPYPGIPMVDLIEHLQQGHRMGKPEFCPEELYDVMKLCWESDPEKRPIFQWLETQLENTISSKTTVIIKCYNLLINTKRVCLVKGKDFIILIASPKCP